MKRTYKFIQIMAALLLITSAGAAQSPLSGDYTVGSQAPGGGDADFSTLFAAVESLKDNGMNGDVRFFIATDLDEAQNIFLGMDTDGNTLTIRPAAGTTPTITFTASVNNSSINGAFVIGASADDWDSLIETRNIIIDGSSTEGGTSRDLTITTLSSTGSSNYVRILGTSRNVTIRNTNISMNQGSFEVVLISPLNRNDTEWVPQDVTLENNLIQTNPSQSSSRAVNVWAVTGTGFESIETAPGPINIIGNDIEARRYGIWLRDATGNAIIRGNTIAINETAALAAYGILIEKAINDDIQIEISSNNITRMRGGNVATAINVVAAGNYEIFNNRITGFETNNPTATAISFNGIHIEDQGFPAELNANINHNTIVMNDLEVEGESGWRYFGFRISSIPRLNVNLRNNIIINNSSSLGLSYAFYQFGSSAVITSDKNNFVVTNRTGGIWLGRLSGSGGTNIGTLSNWQTQTGLDENSVSIAVSFDDDLRLTGTSNGSADLVGTPLASVTTDAFGTARSSTVPTMGAFESSLTAPQLTVSGDAGWRMMSSPVTNFTVAQFAAETAIQGVPGLSNATFPANMYTGYDGTQWTSPSSGSDVLTSGRGFVTYFFNNNNAGSQELPVTITAPGASPLTDVTVTGLHNNGDRWNLLGNPFPYAVNVADITANGGISAHGQVWVDGEGTTNGSGSVNGSWIPTSAEPFNGQIAPWQGVMMRTTEDNPATNVTFPASSTDNTSSLAFQRQLPVRTIQFRLTGEDLYNGKRVEHPATILYMHPEATEATDRHDLELLAPIGGGTVLLYWTERDAQQSNLKIQNSIPYQVTEQMLFDLDVFTYGPSGTFTLDWPHMNGFTDENYEFILTDNLTGDHIDLMAGESYRFQLSRVEQPASTPWEVNPAKTPRFTLRVSPATGTSTETVTEQPHTVSLSQNFPNPFNPTTTIAYSIAEQGMVTLTVYDVTGRRVATLVNQVQAPGQYTASFNAASLSSGLYLYRLETGGTRLTHSMTLIK